MDNLDKTFISIRDFYNQENLRDDGFESTIPLKVYKMSEDYIEFDWSNYVADNKINSFKIQWHCWNTDKREEENLNTNNSKFIIKKCSPGYIYSVRIVALQQSNNILNKSKYIIIQTNSPPDTPILKLR